MKSYVGELPSAGLTGLRERCPGTQEVGTLRAIPEHLRKKTEHHDRSQNQMSVLVCPSNFGN